MGESLRPTGDQEPADLLAACEQAFSKAYIKQMEAPDEDDKYVIIAGETETAFLNIPSEDYDIIMGRPDVESTISEHVAFWVARIDTSSRVRQEYDYLAVRPDDNQLLYLADLNGMPMLPCDAEESRRIIRNISEAEAVPQPNDMVQ